MTKSTAAVILTSAARLAPWGDEAWRFSGAMQLVADGPDWLHVQWNVPGDEPGGGTQPLATMVLRDAPEERAADIAVMAFALLAIPEWKSLESWWAGTEERAALRPRLVELVSAYEGEFKLAVVETRAGAVTEALLAALRDLGFEVARFAASS